MASNVSPASASNKAQYISHLRPKNTDFWRDHKTRFRNIAKVARFFLAIPATSTACERAFGSSGIIISKLRSSIDPRHAKMLLFLNSNPNIAFKWSYVINSN